MRGAQQCHLRRVLVPFDSVIAGAGDLALSLSRFPKPRVAASDRGGDLLPLLPPPLARSARLAVFTRTCTTGLVNKGREGGKGGA